MDMLGDAPELLEQVEMFIKLYPYDVRLGDRVDQLYTALLRAILAAIQWLGRSTCKFSLLRWQLPVPWHGILKGL